MGSVDAPAGRVTARDRPVTRGQTSCARSRHALTPWLRIEESHRDDGTVQVRLEGELDLGSREAVHERLRELQRAGTPTILDLSRITFIDCSGLRVILEALETARYDGTRFELAPERSAPFRRLLELTRNVSGSLPAVGPSHLARDTPRGSAHGPEVLDLTK
jgi:anti-sigma B factor antagonist